MLLPIRVLAAALLLATSLATAAPVPPEGEFSDFMARLGSPDPAQQAAVIADIQARAGRIDPRVLLFLVVTLREQGKAEEALFWFYAAQLRTRQVLAVTAPPELRTAATVWLPVPELVRSEFRTDPKVTAPVIQQVLDWDARTPIDLAWLPTPPALPEAEWPAAFQSVRESLVRFQAEIVTRVQ